MEELNELLNNVNKATQSAKAKIIDTKKEIQNIEDPTVKAILNNALSKAEKGDVNAVQDLIKLARDAHTG